MIEILNKIINFSKKNKIYSGVSLEDLKHIELKIGYSLPKGFDELYRTTNGGKLFNSELLEIIDIINLLNDTTSIEKEDLIIIPNNYVKKVITYKGRIPLFKEKDKLIFIDLDAGENGISGQIVLYYNNTYKVISNDLISFFDNLLNAIDEIYKTNLFKYLIDNNISFLKENIVNNSSIRLDNNKINVEIFNPQNSVFEKEISNKKLNKELFNLIAETFYKINTIFLSRIKNEIIIFDEHQNHSQYTYYEFEDVYNQNNFTLTSNLEYHRKLNSLNMDLLKNMDFKTGYFYQIDDKQNRRYINVNHRIEFLINRKSIKIKYVFNVKEPYIYNEIVKILEYINKLKDNNDVDVIRDDTFEKLDLRIINSVYDLFETEMVKYRFDVIDQSKIDYHSDILSLLTNIEECNWIDPNYALNIVEIESKNIMDLTKDELKKYFSSIIKREKLESGYIAILIDRGIFELLISKLKYYKENSSEIC